METETRVFKTIAELKGLTPSERAEHYRIMLRFYANQSGFSPEAVTVGLPRPMELQVMKKPGGTRTIGHYYGLGAILIHIDRMLDDDENVLFILAHEIGHFRTADKLPWGKHLISVGEFKKAHEKLAIIEGAKIVKQWGLDLSRYIAYSKRVVSTYEETYYFKIEDGYWKKLDC